MLCGPSFWRYVSNGVVEAPAGVCDAMSPAPLSRSHEQSPATSSDLERRETNSWSEDGTVHDAGETQTDHGHDDPRLSTSADCHPHQHHSPTPPTHTSTRAYDEIALTSPPTNCQVHYHSTTVTTTTPT